MAPNSTWRYQCRPAGDFKKTIIADKENCCLDLSEERLQFGLLLGAGELVI